MNRWHEALERLAADWERSLFQSAQDYARKTRNALEVGVHSKHDALLVLAALGYETPESIGAILGTGEEVSR